MLMVLRVVVVFALAVASYIGLAERDFRFLYMGMIGLFIVAFWRFVWLVIQDRSVSVGPEGIKLGSPIAATSPETDGNTRDNYLYLGNFYLSEKRHAEAFQHFLAAYRLQPSILAAFRCMQCAAFAYPDDILRVWFDRALEHTEDQKAELKGRQRFAEWLKGHKSADMGTLRNNLRDLGDDL